MSARGLAVVTLTTLVLAATPALAAGGCPGAKAAAEDRAGQPTHEMAVFSVPEIADDAVVKSLVAALGKQDGVLSARADAKAGKFVVTFATAETSAEILTESIAEISPESKLEKVERAVAVAKHDCGKCPSKATCKKSK